MLSDESDIFNSEVMNDNYTHETKNHNSLTNESDIHYS